MRQPLFKFVDVVVLKGLVLYKVAIYTFLRWCYN